MRRYKYLPCSWPERTPDGGDVVEGCGGDAGGCGAKGEQEGEW